MENESGLSSHDVAAPESPATGSSGTKDTGSEVTGSDIQDTGAAGTAPQEPAGDKRYDDLMSKWQSQEARANRLEQQLSAMQQAQQMAQQPAPPQPEYYKDDWQPESYADLAKAIRQAEENGMKKALDVVRQEQTTAQYAQQQLDAFIGGVKEKDPSFQEQSFYDYASKHKFPLANVNDLSAVLSAYNALRDAEKSTEQRVRANIQKRQGDPTGKSAAPAGNAPRFNPQQFQGMSMRDAVHQALENF